MTIKASSYHKKVKMRPQTWQKKLKRISATLEKARKQDLSDFDFFFLLIFLSLISEYIMLTNQRILILITKLYKLTILISEF